MARHCGGTSTPNHRQQQHHQQPTRLRTIGALACLLLVICAQLHPTALAAESAVHTDAAPLAPEPTAAPTTTTPPQQQPPPTAGTPSPARQQPTAADEEDELVAFEADEDEFEGLAPTASAAAPPAVVPSFPAAEALDRGFLDTYLSALLSPFGMSSPSSSSFSSSWLLASLGGLLVAGAAYLGYAKPWAASARTRRKKKEEHPATQPLLVELKSKRGRVQGQDWVEKNLKKDQDGDEAHEFLGPF